MRQFKVRYKTRVLRIWKTKQFETYQEAIAFHNRKRGFIVA